MNLYVGLGPLVSEADTIERMLGSSAEQGRLGSGTFELELAGQSYRPMIQHKDVALPAPQDAVPNILTRQELYDQVWKEPLSKLAPRFGLSGRGLKKVCTRHKIPTPGRGYCQRLRHGYRVRRKKLPKLKSDDPNPTIDLGAAKRRSTEIEPLEEGPVADQEQFEALPENKIEVKDNLRGSHPLIRQTRQAWKERSQEGYWRRKHKTKGLDIAVSKGARRRALLIMNALLKALEQRGIEVSSGEDEKASTIVHVHGQEVKIRLEERRKRIKVKREHDYPWSDEFRYDLEWTGRLTLLIDSFLNIPRKSWTDGKKQRLEDCLNAFVVALVSESEARKDWRRRREEADRQREKVRQRRLEERRQEQLESERAEEIRRQVDRWILKETILLYLAWCEKETIQPAGPDLNGSQWIIWAKRYANSLTSK